MSDYSRSRSTCFLTFTCQIPQLDQLQLERSRPHHTFCLSLHKQLTFQHKYTRKHKQIGNRVKSGRNEALFSKFQLSCLLPSTSVLSQKHYHYHEIQTAYSQTDWMTSTKLFKLKLLHTLPQSLIDWSLCPS